MPLSQKQLGQTFQIGKVANKKKRKREREEGRQIPRLKPPQKGLAAELGKSCTEWGLGRDPEASLGVMPLFPGSLGGGAAGAGGAQPFLSLLEWLSFRVSQWVVSGFFWKKGWKTTGLPLGNGKTEVRWAWYQEANSRAKL